MRAMKSLAILITFGRGVASVYAKYTLGLRPTPWLLLSTRVATYIMNHGIDARGANGRFVLILGCPWIC